MSKELPDEIRDAWEPTEGDYFAEEYRNQRTTVDVYYNCPEEDNLGYVDNPIWLPRQDQLQDMLSDSIREILFYNQMILDGWDSKHTTMEQLWLMLVMDKKYNKVWNGEKWVSKDG